MISGRAGTGEYARRVNHAMELQARGLPSGDVARELAREYGISVRQGWRYARDAAERSQPLRIPEQKIVFTVKLPKSLAEHVRAIAASRGQTLSALVTEALEGLVRRLRRERPDGGQEN